MTIEWRDVVGYEGYYKVNNLGQVKRTKAGMGTRCRILRPGKQTTGYLFVGLCKDCVPKNHRVHRLVAIAFLENKDNKPTVNHIDGNIENNCVDNLEWMTVSENHRHAHKYLGKVNYCPGKGKFGKEHNRSKSFKLQWPCGKTATYGSGLEFTRLTGLDHTTISYARKKGVPYVFKKKPWVGYILLEA